MLKKSIVRLVKLLAPLMMVGEQVEGVKYDELVEIHYKMVNCVMDKY